MASLCLGMILVVLLSKGYDTFPISIAHLWYTIHQNALAIAQRFRQQQQKRVEPIGRGDMRDLQRLALFMPVSSGLLLADGKSRCQRYCCLPARRNRQPFRCRQTHPCTIQVPHQCSALHCHQFADYTSRASVLRWRYLQQFTSIHEHQATAALHPSAFRPVGDRTRLPTSFVSAIFLFFHLNHLPKAIFV